ncbi:helix-turn-helix domain-containing protein [Ponticoccus sp. SC2-23]|nr:helix-turn-helix domain-containing protein [Ponticoccus sp. SC6-9]MBM1224160.1 helix-turn-helix domain-containing protein [Ponticoccus sp. SC6-15]MBM1230061.1 helix-turn-helix domain-containing protein [Ponticoccus sp. SC6-38]MBM1233126.1 helix-turn-helix domain-containing protein [Ponticoccus sp. SC6-45]MBM1236924.1 helix-turn-helix domain-containing protein [Ponticoccus sp. SC6-49]MBM1242137.1 helix-turn-helix domain-containing protein [Ponticoccus sp. SC2-64]MBM1246650.1 helix-turn-heli
MKSRICAEIIQRMMAGKGWNAAALSLAAGLNRRAIKDILVGRAASPKLSTVFKIARALPCDPCELMGLGPRVSLAPALLRLLEQYDEDEQEQLAQALAALPHHPRT